MYSRKLTVEALDHFTFFLLYYGLFSALAFVASNNIAAFAHGLLLLIPLVINFVIRRFVKRLGFLLLAHSPMPILVGILLAPFAATFWWVVMAIALAIHSVVFAFRGPPTEKASFLAACFFVLGGFGLWAALVGGVTAPIFPIVLMAAVVGRILLIRMIKMDTSLDTMLNTYKQPIGEIARFDYKLMVGLGAAIAVVAVVIYLAFFAPVVGLVMDNLPDVPRFELETEGRSLHDGHGRLEPTPPSGSPFRIGQQRNFWNTMASILFFITGIALTIGIAYGAYIIIKYIVTRKADKGEPGAEIFEFGDTREFILPKSHNRRKRRTAEADLHPIRRLFRDTAKKHIKMGVSIKKSDTPTDIAKRITAEDISNLAEDYAEVRYK